MSFEGRYKAKLVWRSFGFSGKHDDIHGVVFYLVKNNALFGMGFVDMDGD